MLSEGEAGARGQRRYVAGEMMAAMGGEGRGMEPVSEWREVPLGELVRCQSGFAFKSRDWTTAGVPVVKIRDVRSGVVRLDGASFVAADTAAAAERFLLRRGDVLITMSGEIGSVGVYKHERPALLNQRVGRFELLNSEAADLNFLTFALQDPAQKRYFESVAYGVAQPNISPSLIGRARVRIPSLVTQRRIAAVLAAFDELIEIHERRIELLEDLARSLYREWFVHLRFSGHEDIRVVESALGPLPEGWKVGTLDAIVHTLESGSRPRGGIEAQERSVPSVGAENVLGLGKYDYGKEKYISREFADGMRRGRVQDRDVLLYKDGAYIGRASMFRDGFPHDECYVNEHVFLIRTNHQYSQSLLYFWLADASNLQRVRSLNANAAQPGLNQARLRGLTLQIPSPEQVKALDDAAEPMLAALFALAKARVALARTRDLLLPWLVTGRLDISDVDLGILTPTEVE